MSTSRSTHVKSLTEQFLANFPEKREGLRLIGREAEYPVVLEDGTAANVQAFWPLLMEAGDLTPLYEGESLIVGLEGSEFTYSLEVGWGTIEVITRPCQDLHELAEVHSRAFQRLRDAADQLGYQILGYGIQPRTPGSTELMSPKERYSLLHDVIGPTWLHFTSTASDQIHIDISRSEIATVHNLCNLLTPAIIALCANSPISGGTPSGFHSAREGFMGEIYTAACRHGMPTGPISNMEDWIQQLCDQEHILHKAEGQYYPKQGLFHEFLAQHGADFEAFLVHEHYIWNSARMRSAHGTVELRAACQQPHHENMVVAALSLGMVEASQPLMNWLEQKLGEEAWPTLRKYGEDTIRQGLSAAEPFEGFLHTILTHVEAGLKSRSLGEEAFLQPLWKRLESRKNPAQQGLEAFGVKDFRALVRLRSHSTPNG